jgi:hypothetical protein
MVHFSCSVRLDEKGVLYTMGKQVEPRSPNRLNLLGLPVLLGLPTSLGWIAPPASLATE